MKPSMTYLQIQSWVSMGRWACVEEFLRGCADHCLTLGGRRRCCCSSSLRLKAVQIQPVWKKIHIDLEADARSSPWATWGPFLSAYHPDKGSPEFIMRTDGLHKNKHKSYRWVKAFANVISEDGDAQSFHQWRWGGSSSRLREWKQFLRGHRASQCSF